FRAVGRKIRRLVERISARLILPGILQVRRRPLYEISHLNHVGAGAAHAIEKLGFLYAFRPEDAPSITRKLWQKNPVRVVVGLVVQLPHSFAISCNEPDIAVTAKPWQRGVRRSFVFTLFGDEYQVLAAGMPLGRALMPVR